MNDSLFHFLCVFFGVQSFLDAYHHSCNASYGRIGITMNLKKNILRARFLYNSVNKKPLFYIFFISTAKLEGNHD